jgi:Pentapeptide repeats (8 copies)
MLLLHLTAQSQAQFEWRDASGNVRSLSDLEEILRKHRQWVESDEKEKREETRADLHGADLHGANLPGANLEGADLSGATLEDAHLNRADLTVATLKGADLWGANLEDAGLGGANLHGANLGNAKLTGAWFSSANLGGAIFEPRSLPNLRGIAAAKNLQSLVYVINPDALVQLRKQFEDAGFREQEREITYALKRVEAEVSCLECISRIFPRIKDPYEVRTGLVESRGILANCGSCVFNKAFFDWTCQYGLSPGRPLILGLLLWFLCSLLYFGFIHTSGESGLYRVYGQSVGEDPKAQRRVERISLQDTRQLRGLRWLFQFFRREFLLLRTSMFFSLMSAFNIGFRDINFGRWLRLLTRQEFDIKAVGWARVIAGWQSLISVFLIALWVLTYFGRPFD